MTTILSRFKRFGAALVLAAGARRRRDGARRRAGRAAVRLQPRHPRERRTSCRSARSRTRGRSETSTEDSTRRGGYYDPGTTTTSTTASVTDRSSAAFATTASSASSIVRYLRGERVEATAYWGRYQYSMRIDRCTGVVDRVRLIRRSGFGLQFNFSN